MASLQIPTDNKETHLTTDESENGTHNIVSPMSDAVVVSPTASDGVSSPVNGVKSPRRPTHLTESQSQYLERRIAGRPSASSLENSGVLKTGGRFAAAKVSLQQEMRNRVIAKHIESRPDHSELVKAGVVSDPSSVAPVLQSTAKKLERQIIANTLNQKLGDRAPPEELPAHIVKRDGVAPRLQISKQKLQHAITRDQVSHLLESRPEVSELVRQNILQQQTSPTSSRLQAVQKQLQHHMTTDRLSHLLEKRSEVDTLQSQNILKDPRVAPSLQGVQRTLQQNLAKANLYHALKQRPSIDELQKRGIYTNQDLSADGEVDTTDPEVGSDIYDDGYESKNDSQRAAQAAAQAYAAQAYAAQLQAHARALHQRSYSSSAATSSSSSHHHHHPSAPSSSSQQPSITLPSAEARKRATRGSITEGQSSSAAQQQQHAHAHAQYHAYARNSYSGPTSSSLLPQTQAPLPSNPYSSAYEPLRRSKAFHLTRILLKSVAALAQAGEISVQQKSFLKDLIVDQDRTILAVAEMFDNDEDVAEFKDSLCRLAARRGGV